MLALTHVIERAVWQQQLNTVSRCKPSLLQAASLKTLAHGTIYVMYTTCSS